MSLNGIEGTATNLSCIALSCLFCTRSFFSDLIKSSSAPPHSLMAPLFDLTDCRWAARAPGHEKARNDPVYAARPSCCSCAAYKCGSVRWQGWKEAALLSLCSYPVKPFTHSCMWKLVKRSSENRESIDCLRLFCPGLQFVSHTFCPFDYFSCHVYEQEMRQCATSDRHLFVFNVSVYL